MRGSERFRAAGTRPAGGKRGPGVRTQPAKCGRGAARPELLRCVCVTGRIHLQRGRNAASRGLTASCTLPSPALPLGAWMSTWLDVRRRKAAMKSPKPKIASHRAFVIK